MPARKMRKRPEGKRVVACETMEEEEQWSETWERYHGKCGETFREKTTVWWWVKRKVMDKTEREGVCIVKRGGWQKEEGWGRAIVQFLTPPQTTPWQAVNHRSSLDWFFSSFQSALHRASFSFVGMHPDANSTSNFLFFFILHVRTKLRLSNQLS